MGDAVLAFPVSAPLCDDPPPTFRERAALVRSPCFWPALPGKAPLSPVERAGLLRLAATIPGEASDEALVAFIEALRHAPPGDIVEIGSGAGRTAALLAWLSRRYHVGSVLCRDDWDTAALADFEIAVAPLADGRLNYLRGCETAGYGAAFTASTAAFGETQYQGRIAMLHIASGAATAEWLPFMTPAGWIVTSGGASPVNLPRERVCAVFDAGGARFLQLKR
ncbi:MAG TPA: hypothetical protein VMU37_06745 [Caulobacteraceae bacterium]|nr:hypothetical protein [Caulobacteraceae bacterium]